MARKDKRNDKIRNNPGNVHFKELASWLTEQGFTLTRVNGSHHVFSHPKGKLLNLQPDGNGKAKPYQVKQALKAVDELKEYSA